LTASFGSPFFLRDLQLLAERVDGTLENTAPGMMLS
jgi:hypothetical protein